MPYAGIAACMLGLKDLISPALYAPDGEGTIVLLNPCMGTIERSLLEMIHAFYNLPGRKCPGICEYSSYDKDNILPSVPGN